MTAAVLYWEAWIGLVRRCEIQCIKDQEINLKMNEMT